MKKDEYQFIISRYDHFYDSVNTKGQFFLGLNTFILGSIGLGFFSIKDVSTAPLNLIIITILLGSTGLLSVYFVLKAIIPFWGSSDKKLIPSLISFEKVKTLKRDMYIEQAKNCDEVSYEKDLAQQAHELAIGLSKKFHRLKWAGWCIMLQFLLLIPFTTLIFQHLKN